MRGSIYWTEHILPKTKMIKKLKQKIQHRKIKKAQEREYLRNLPSSFDDEKISWITPEYIKYEKGLIWKIAVILLILAAVSWGIVSKAWTFSLAMVVFAVVYYAMIHRDHPKAVRVTLSDIGIKVGHRKYSYSQIKAFWIIYNPPYIKTLHIRVQNDIALDIPIYLHNQDPAEIREFLIEKLPELEGHKESFSDVLLRIFKI